MDAREYVRMGLEGLTDHKLRSFLTMLGIILGVASVIAMLAIGEGAKRAALEKFKLLGVDNIIVRDKALTDQELDEVRAKFSQGLSLDDADAVRKIVPTVRNIAPQAEKILDARYEDKIVRATVVGVTPILLQILNYELSDGMFLTDDHNNKEMRVCILGADVARSFFPTENPLGRMVKLEDQWFEVLGVMGSRSLYTETVGELAARNLNQDIYIPLSSFLRRFSKENPLASQIDQLTVKVNDSAQLVETAAVIRRILDRRHYRTNDYDLVIPYELLKQEEKERRIYNLVLGSIAAISLLVGGIGIMNIMLATVLERTREIGIRRALGARRKDIMILFLLEAVGLGLTGGLIGVFLGVALAHIVSGIGNFNAVVSVIHVFLAFFVAAIVGIVSGTFPAKRAADVNPIEALRYE